MNFWQENKAFVIVVGVAVLALFFLWPSLFDLGPAIVSLDRTAYDRTELEHRKLASTLEKYFHPKGKTPVAVTLALKDVKQANQLLLSNFEEMHRWMIYVNRFPFRIPDLFTGNERQAYVSRSYTYMQTGEFFLKEKEFAVKNPYDGLVFLAGARNIKLGDPKFGMHDMDIPGAIKDPEVSIMQIGLIHDLGHLAIRVGVDEILAMSPGEPYTWAVKGTQVAKAYPVTLQVSSDLPTLLALLHGLDGTHGTVVEVETPAEEAPARPVAALDTPRAGVAGPVGPKAEPKPEPKAAAPKADAKAEPKAEPKAAPKAELKEDVKEDRPAPEPREAASPKIIIQVQGRPSFYVSTPEKEEAEQAGFKERLTIFRPSETDPHVLQFVANAIIARVIRDEKGEPTDRVEAVIEPLSNVVFGADGKTTRNVVRKGDFASSRFFLVRSIKVKVAEAKIDKDRDGFPTDVIPAHLETELSVAALQFLKSEAPKAAVETKAAKPAAEPRAGPKVPRL